MRLLIMSCRYCLRDKTICEYRKKIKSAVNAIDEQGTLTHRCSVYWTLIPSGTRVRVELKELEVGEIGGGMTDQDPPEPWAEWVGAGWVEGTIVGRSTVGSNFFLVKLDKEVSLCLPPQGGSWYDAQPTDVKYRAKRPKDMKILTVTTPQEDE